MPGGPNAGGAMHVETDVAVRVADRLAGMDPHPNLDRCPVWPGVLYQCLLGRYRCRHCITGPRERHQEGIPLGVDLQPIAFRECRAEETPLFFEDLRIPAVAEPLKERGRAFDVGEEEVTVPVGRLGMGGLRP